MKKYTIPIDLWELDEDGYHIVINARWHSRTIRLLIDTGANHSCLDKAFFVSVMGNEVATEPEGHNVGIGGSDFVSEITTLNELKIQRIKIAPMQIRLLDLSMINTTYAMMYYPKIDGILGGDFLRRHRAIIDYEALTLTFVR